MCCCHVHAVLPDVHINNAVMLIVTMCAVVTTTSTAANRWAENDAGVST